MNVPSFKCLSYAGPVEGPALIVLGAVHGDEICGTQAIERIVGDLDTGVLRLTCGRVTFVPITNPLAYLARRRTGDRNLNRRLATTPSPVDYEDHVANWLCPLLSQHDALLDLHSFQSGGQPFVMVGPEDNGDSLQPFTHAGKELALARRLGVVRAVDGWLSTYAEGVAARRRFAELHPDAAPGLDLDPRYGIGTTEFMRSVGGWGLTLECGQHADPNAVVVAHTAVMNTLAHLGMVAGNLPPVQDAMQGLRLCHVVDKLDRADTLARDWASFDSFDAGDLIATRQDGAKITAVFDGWIVFPNARSSPGQEWFYLAKQNERFNDLLVGTP